MAWNLGISNNALKNIYSTFYGLELKRKYMPYGVYEAVLRKRVNLILWKKNLNFIIPASSQMTI